MTLVSCKNGSNNLLKIELSDGSAFLLKNCYLNHFFGIKDDDEDPDASDSLPKSEYTQTSAIPEEGSEITPLSEEAFRFASLCYKTERTGMRLIARAEQTGAGLARKLEARGHEPSCVSAVIDQFRKSGLVNDSRFAELWLRSKLSRNGGKIAGPRHLSASLAGRGIKGKALKDAFDKVLDEETEYTLLQRFMSKNRGISAGSRSLRSRLRYEGFSSTAINRYIDEFGDS